MNNREYEIRLYEIDESKIKKIIKENNGILINKKRVMKIYTYNHPNNKKDSYIRIRDEGKQITLTIKTKLNSKYPIEREIEINNIEEADAILKFLGCKPKYYVEKIRETFQLGNSKEIVFDSYPGLPTYMEIDCHDEANLKKIANLLGFELSDHKKFNGKKVSVTDLYFELYGINNNKRKKGNLTFKDAKKNYEKLIKKNKTQFNQILKEQLKIS